jgi:hypothetical protein
MATKQPPRIPDRECSITASSWADLLAVDRDTISELFAKVPPDMLRLAHETAPKEIGFDVLVGDQRVSLWLDEDRLAVMER